MKSRNSFGVEWLATLKGLATYVGPLNWCRKRRMRGGHTEDPEYCYSVWMRHVCTMKKFGWHPSGKKICELGPGNSAGTGVAALLSGAESYTGLDAFPYAFASNEKRTRELIRRLCELYAARSPIPGPDRFPEIHPELEQYDFPLWLVDEVETGPQISRCEALARDAECGLLSNRLVYLAPYESMDLPDVAGTFDAVFSQAVLEHVADVAGTYQLIFQLLKPSGWSWHVIDFRSHGLTYAWNGHWCIPKWQWKIVVGRRKFLLNRVPLSDHLEFAAHAGFTVRSVLAYRESDLSGQRAKGALGPESFVAPFNQMSCDDASTMGAMVILQKP